MAGVSHGRVIVDCELALKQYLNVEKVVQAMVDKKLISKKIRKALVKDKQLFVDTLKTLKLEQFGVFLSLVRTIEEEEGKDRATMKLLSSSLKSMKLKQGSNIRAIVDDFIKAADKMPTSTQQPPQPFTCIGSLTGSVKELSTKVEESARVEIMSSLTSQVEGASSTADLDANKTDHTTQADDDCSSSGDIHFGQASAIEPQLPFPSGYLRGSGMIKIMSFTKEGGMLYSAVHGVMVIIPKAAVPPSIEKFILGMYVYLKGPFSLPEDATPCSPVVWFYLHPKFTFEADVTVKMAHSALVQQLSTGNHNPSSRLPTKDEEDGENDEEEYLTVLTIEEGHDEAGASSFTLTRQLTADFSDGYHAVFAVRHFSPHRVAKRRKKQQSTSRNRLGSNESSGVRKRTSSNQSSMANCLPHKGQTATTKDLQKSGSLQDKEDELYSQVDRRDTSKKKLKSGDGQINLEFFVARCMPMDRSTSSWNVDFLVSQFHPTGVFVSIDFFIYRTEYIIGIGCSIINSGMQNSI